MRTIRVGILTAGDSTDPNCWSGTPYYMSRALRRHGCEVVPLGPVPQTQPRTARLLDRASRRLFGTHYRWEHSVTASRSYAAHFRERLRSSPVDVVLAPAGSVELAFLNPRVPVVYLSDATFTLMEEYYPEFSNLSWLSRREGRLIERRAIHRADLLLYPTRWAARSALEDFGAQPARIRIVPFGADPDQAPSREEALNREESDVCRLLFVGKDWQRKGGQIALDALRALGAMGVDARLTMCGTTPPEPLPDANVQVIPYLDRNDPVQNRRLRELFATADFLLLPTRQECFGIVFAEANACGVPAVTCDTGGVTEVVVHGENGLVLSPVACGPEYAEAIAAVWQERSDLLELRNASRNAFDTRLNWSVWGEAVSDLVSQIA